jgi:hypothetical protein
LHHPVAIMPSITAHRRCALGPLPSSSRCPLPLRSRRTVHCRRGAVAPSLAVTEPLAVSTGRPHRGRSHHQHPSLITPLPGLSTGWLLRCVSPCRRLPSDGTSHCGTAFISCLSSFRLVVPSPCFSHRHLPSSGASASHRAATSCHAPLGPLVRLVKASPLLTPPPPICGIIENNQWSSLILV